MVYNQPRFHTKVTKIKRVSELLVCLAKKENKNFYTDAVSM